MSTSPETPMLDVVVKRSEWLRGEGGGWSYLLRGDGKKCCVGFACIAAGLTEGQIRLLKAVSDFSVQAIAVPAPLLALVKVDNHHVSSYTATNLYSANDRVETAPEHREAAIIRFGKDVGINFSFVD